MALRPEDIQGYLSANKLDFTPEGIQKGLAQYNTANPNAQYSLADLGQAYGQNKVQTANWMNAGKPQTFEGLFGKDVYTQRPNASGFTLLSTPTVEQRGAYLRQHVPLMNQGEDQRPLPDMQNIWGETVKPTSDRLSSTFPSFGTPGGDQVSEYNQIINDLGHEQNVFDTMKGMNPTGHGTKAWTYDTKNQEYVDPWGKRVSVAGLGKADPTTASFEVGRLASLGGKNLDTWSAHGVGGSGWGQDRAGDKAEIYRNALVNELPTITAYESKASGLDKFADIVHAAAPTIALGMLAPHAIGALSNAFGVSAPTSLMGGSGSLLGTTGSKFADSAIGSALKSAGTQLVTTGTINPTSVLTSGLTGGTNSVIPSYLPDTGSSIVNDALKGAATSTVGSALRGGDVGTAALTGGFGGGFSSAADQYLPDTGDATMNKIIRDAVVGTGKGALSQYTASQQPTRTVRPKTVRPRPKTQRVRRYDEGGFVDGFDDWGSDFTEGYSDYVYDDLNYDSYDDTDSYDNVGASTPSDWYDTPQTATDVPDTPQYMDLDKLLHPANTPGVSSPNDTMSRPDMNPDYKPTEWTFGPNGELVPPSDWGGWNVPSTSGGGGQPQQGKGLWDSIKGVITPDNMAKWLTLASAATGGTKPFTQSATATRPQSLLDVPLASIPRAAPKPLAVNQYQGDYTKYGQPGQGGEHMFVKAACGGHMQGGGALGRASEMYVSGGSSGQADDVPAVLSHGEYVMDADIVSALGDGNNAAGAAALDRMREKIRKHKRSAPASSIPPKAKKPEQYLKKGK